MIPTNPHAVVQIGAERFDSWREAQLFESVAVELSTNEASEAAWRVFDPEFFYINKWTTAERLIEMPVKVWLGFDSPMLVFDGLLARVERGPAVSTFRAYDRGFVMRRVQKTEHYKGLNDLQIIEKLAKRNGLNFEGPNEPVKLEKHQRESQSAQTDWDYALQRAEDAGLVLYVRGNTLYAKEPLKTAANPLVTLVYKKDFLMLDDFDLSFRVPDNQEGRPAKVEVRGRGRGGRRLKGRATPHARGTERITLKRDLKIRSRGHAERRAEAKKALKREHAFTCSVSLLPTFTGRRPDVRDTVALAELGKLFSGKYLVDKASHRFEPGQLSMSLELFRDVKS